MNHQWPVKEIIATYSLTLFPLPLAQKSTSAGVQVCNLYQKLRMERKAAVHTYPYVCSYFGKKYSSKILAVTSTIANIPLSTWKYKIIFVVFLTDSHHN